MLAGGEGAIVEGLLVEDWGHGGRDRRGDVSILPVFLRSSSVIC
jgi:hypothetical protein